MGSRPQARNLPGFLGRGCAYLRQIVADELRNMGWGEVRIVLLGHASIRVAESGSDHLERDAGFREEAGVAVAEDMERHGWLNFGVRAGLSHGTVLVGRAPSGTVLMGEHQCLPRPPDR
jgi:hypothetical protein